MTILSILAAIGLFILLALAAFRSASSKNRSIESLFDADSDSANEARVHDPGFSRQILSRVFSDEDSTFVDDLGSAELRGALLAERKRLAIRWIRSNAVEAGSTVHAHMLLAAKAGDLRVLGEARLVLRYLELLLVCSFLIVLVWTFGPGGLRGLAEQADVLMAVLRGWRGGADSHGRVVSGG
jgi:hypothetical protein